MAVLGGANTGGVDFCEQQTQPVLGQQSLICAKSEHVRPSGVLRPGVPTPEHQCRGAWVLRCCSRLLQRTARRAVQCTVGSPPTPASGKDKLELHYSKSATPKPTPDTIRCSRAISRVCDDDIPQVTLSFDETKSGSTACTTTVIGVISIFDRLLLPHTTELGLGGFH